MHHVRRGLLLGLRVSWRKVPEQQVHDRQVILWALLLLAGCGGAAADPCANVPCSEGRVCVVRSAGRVACEVPDAGPP